MLTTAIRHRLFLPVLALAAALPASVCLTTMGLAKVQSVLEGGDNYADFPTGGLSAPRLLLNAAFLVLNAIYLVWLFRPGSNEPSFPPLLRRGAVFLLVAWATYPLSNDVYVYLQYGLMGLNGVNPYLTPAGSFASSLSPLLHWQQTSSYGPVSESFFMLAALAVPIGPPVAVYAFKVFCLVFHVTNAYAIWRLLQDSPLRGKVTMAYLANPMLLIEQVAGAHVDAIFCTTLVLLMGCLLRRAFVAAVGALWLGFLAKTLSIIWLPLLGAFLIRQRRLRELAAGIGLSLGVVIALCLTVLPTLDAWRSLVNPGVTGRTARSLHHLVDLSLGFVPDLPREAQEKVLSGFTLAAYGLYALLYLGILLRLFFRPGYAEANLVTDLGWTALLLFLVATPWVMPWYPSVLLPIAALSLHSPLFVATVLASCVASGLIVGSGSGRKPISLLTSLSTVGPPLVVLLLGWWSKGLRLEREAKLDAGG